VEVSRRARREGATNLAFALGRWEDLPGPFAGMVNSLSVLFPWGSLFRAVLSAEQPFVHAVRCLLKSDACFTVVTAVDGAADAGELRRLGLEHCDVARTAERWRRAGFISTSLEALPPEHEYQTTWWRKIRQREGRIATRLILTR
jgi:hypothetical protein